MPFVKQHIRSLLETMEYDTVKQKAREIKALEKEAITATGNEKEELEANIELKKFELGKYLRN
jgi:hypothetical protein